MPSVPSYPGVYVEELPGNGRTITGVATSIIAMVGRTRRGPLNRPVRIASFAEFERIFGGLWDDAPLTFAALHCFRNGGREMLVVRVANGATTCSATLPNDAGGDSLVLEAATSIDGETRADPGAWATTLVAAVDYDSADGTPLVAPLFNLTLTDLATGVREAHLNLAADSASPRFATRVLGASSRLARVASSDGTRPAVTPPGAPVPFLDASVAPATADGAAITAEQVVSGSSLEAAREGLFALEHADLFNILCLPPYAPNADVEAQDLPAALAYCARRRAILLVDPPAAVSTVDAARAFVHGLPRSENAALYFPRLLAPNPLHANRVEPYAPCGAVAGVLARTDARRGVWKTPAGLEATLDGITALAARLTDRENGTLNALGVNCLREFPGTGQVVWGGRTLCGADGPPSQWKYLAVRRTALFLEQSLYRGLQWAAFEPNGEPLWAQIRQAVEPFLHALFRQGAFQGASAREAFFVKCGSETTTPGDIEQGIINILVGFAPLKPAEFVIIALKQKAGPPAA